MSSKSPRPSDEARLEVSRMSLSDHIEELRSRIIRALVGVAGASVVCLYFGDEILSFLQTPVVATLGEYGYSADLKYFSPAEYFGAYVRVGLMCGLMLASPWVFYHIWAFVGAGLYRHERRMVLLFGPSSLVLFIAGLVCMYYAVLPLTLRFFIRFGEGMATPWFTWGAYVSMVLSFAFGFGIGFQTPLVVIFLAVTHLVPLGQLRKMRRYIIVGVLAVAAILTPPDWQSQVLLALPMLGLYELGLLAAWLIVGKGKDSAERAE